VKSTARDLAVALNQLEQWLDRASGDVPRRSTIGPRDDIRVASPRSDGCRILVRLVLISSARRWSPRVVAARCAARLPSSLPPG
jgi:hypothetical protein